jgi:hypothetical protein
LEKGVVNSDLIIFLYPYEWIQKSYT